MSEPPRRSERSTAEIELPESKKRDARKLAERAEAHERWIGDDGEPVCRGID
jgi:hypothetical protein